MICNLVAGLFIDYGDQFGNELSSENIYELNQKFKSLPFQAIKGRLAGE